MTRRQKIMEWIEQSAPNFAALRLISGGSLTLEGYCRACQHSVSPSGGFCRLLTGPDVESQITSYDEDQTFNEGRCCRFALDLQALGELKT
jgi:hypothetical protein